MQIDEGEGLQQAYNLAGALGCREENADGRSYEGVGRTPYEEGDQRLVQVVETYDESLAFAQVLAGLRDLVDQDDLGDQNAAEVPLEEGPYVEAGRGQDEALAVDVALAENAEVEDKGKAPGAAAGGTAAEAQDTDDFDVEAD